MRWPHGAAPAAPVHAGFLVTAVGATVGYALADAPGRTIVYGLVTLFPVVTFLAALWSGHLPDRLPWSIALVGLVLLSTSHLRWPGWIPDHHFGRAEASAADLTIGTAHLLFMIGIGMALRRHAVDDGGGVLECAMVGLCAGGPLWEWVIRPHLVPGAPQSGEVLLLSDLLVLAGCIGGLARLAVTAKKARGPLGYLLLTVVATLAGNAAAVFTVHATSVYTAVFMMAAYLAMATAPLHPAAPYCTLPPDAANRRPSHPHLGWLGAALCVNPLVAAVQTIRGADRATLLLPVGTLLVIPLVLLRFRQLSALRARAERTLAHHASHDELTGLYNRRHIVGEIDRALDEVRRDELDGVAVLLCDLDGFKPVNDRLGHQAGDLVLQAVAARLVESVRSDDIVGRLGGDEFVVVCRGGQPHTVTAVENRILATVAAPVQLPGTQVTVGITIGSAVAGPGTTLDRDGLIGIADGSMYASKALRRPGRPGASAPAPVSGSRPRPRSGRYCAPPGP